MKKTMNAILFLCTLLLGATLLQLHARAATNVTYKNNTYFAEDGTIYRMNRNTGTFKAVMKLKDSNTAQLECVKDGWLYLVVDKYYCVLGTDGSRPYIYRMKPDGSHLELLAEGNSPVISGDTIYYNRIKIHKKEVYRNKCKGIYRMNLDGTDKKEVYKADTYTSWLKLYQDTLYFNDDTAVRSLSLKTGKTKELSVDTSVSDISDACFIDGFMYYTKNNTDRCVIQRYDLSNDTQEALSDGRVMASRNSKLYYVSETKNKNILCSYDTITQKSSELFRRKSIINVIPDDNYIICNCIKRINIHCQIVNLKTGKYKLVTKYFRP
ncbi:MAG: DUF5050 domain-containing protein [Lachnospiraceae bacterium]